MVSDTLNVSNKIITNTTLAVPTKPPTILMVIIMSKSEICVHWTPLESGAADGYVIVYEDNMSKNTTVVEGESISQYNISGLSSEHYTISMVAYLELSSQLSESVEVWLKGEWITVVHISLLTALIILSTWSS